MPCLRLPVLIIDIAILSGILEFFKGFLMLNRKRLIILTVSIFFGITAVIFAYANNKAHTKAEETYFTDSIKKLETVDDYINMFFELYRSHIVRLASNPNLVIAEADFPSYREKVGEYTWNFENLSDIGKSVVQSWRDLIEKDNDIADIYAGFNSGASISYEAYEFPVGFLGSLRPWYIAAMSSDNDVNIGHAYLSLSGQTVTPITHKIYNLKNEVIGVIGLDISLSTITNYIEDLNFGKTGFFLLVEETGRILCNTKYAHNNFRFLHEMPEEVWEEIFLSKKPFHVIKLSDDKTYFISTYQGTSGYLLMSIASQEEILSEVDKSLNMIFLIFSFVLVFIFLLFFHFKYR